MESSLIATTIATLSYMCFLGVSVNTLIQTEYSFETIVNVIANSLGVLAYAAYTHSELIYTNKKRNFTRENQLLLVNGMR